MFQVVAKLAVLQEPKADQQTAVQPVAASVGAAAPAQRVAALGAQVILAQPAAALAAQVIRAQPAVAGEVPDWEQALLEQFLPPHNLFH